MMPTRAGARVVPACAHNGGKTGNVPAHAGRGHNRDVGGTTLMGMGFPLMRPQRLIEAIILLQVGIFIAGTMMIIANGETDRAAMTLVFAAVVVGVTAVCAIILGRRQRTITYAYVLLGLLAFFTLGALASGIWGWGSPTAVLVRSLVPLSTIYIVAAFDSGRPSTWVDRRVTVPALVVAAALLVAVFMTTRQVPGGLVALQCDSACTSGWLNVTDSPGAGEVLSRMYLVVRGVAVLAMSAGIIVRLRTLRGSRLTEFAYLGVTALLWGVGVLAQAVVQVVDLYAYERMGPLYVGQLALRVLLPLALLLGLMLGELRRGSLIEQEFAKVRGARTRDEVRDRLRGLLEDPQLEIVAVGDEVPAPVGIAEVTELHAEDGRMVATVIHRPGLAVDLPVPYAVSIPAATSALERLALEEQIRELQQDVTSARAAAMAAGDAERARIERDLHDGAQARIVLLRGRINRLARESRAGDAGIEEGIASLGNDLDGVLQEVRSLSSGLRPLRPGTLVTSVRDCLAEVPLRTEMNAGDPGDVPEAVEVAVYFCIREAVQNAIKHAGPDAAVRVQIAREGDILAFTVIDDGEGIPEDAASRPAGGIDGMRARMAGVGGALEVMRGAAGGTVVTGRAPVQATADSSRLAR